MPSIFETLGYLTYSVSYCFSRLLTAEVILGMGGSFISGADSAMLFESLVTTQHQHRYLQFEGRILTGILLLILAILAGSRFIMYMPEIFSRAS